MKKIWLPSVLLFCLLSLCRIGECQSDDNRYAHPELLVETSWVAAHLTDASVRIIDMRDEKSYNAGHLPNAVRIAEAPLRNPEDKFTYLPRPEVFAGMLEKAGIGNRTHVIIYDDQGGRMAARFWYVLNAFGHRNVSLMNGGWNKWSQEKRPTSTEAPAVATIRFTVASQPDMSCALPAFLARKPGVVVLDTRSPDEYTGKTVSPHAARAGRVPGAVNVEWKENVSGPNLEFKSAQELRTLYAAKGITTDKEIVVHCASGGRAAQSLFTLKLLGYPKVKVYYGSFSDYASLPDVPVEQ